MKQTLLRVWTKIHAKTRMYFVQCSILQGALLLLMIPQTWAFSWQDLWITKDHQAQLLMNSGQFSKAQETFKDPAWQATAAYRAGDYKNAAIRYQTLKNNADAYYNQGNAFAHSGKLKQAITAYDNALALNPGMQDALHNRAIVKELLKKQDKEKQNKQDQNKPNQDKQDQEKQDQDKQDQNKQDQNKQDQNKQDQNKQDQNKQDQDKQDQDKHEKPPEKTPISQADREQQQAKEQWLHLIPDDPGGLIREKFLRDYLKRHRQH